MDYKGLKFKSTSELGKDSIKLSLNSGFKYIVAVLNSKLGCSDVCDACEISGAVLLYKKNDSYWIDTIDVAEPENLLVTDDINYIFDIVSWWKPIEE